VRRAQGQAPSTFPAMGGRYRVGRPALSNRPRARYEFAVVTREEILWLGIASGVSGGLVGGIMLGIGMNLIVGGEHLGWLLLLPGAPASGIIGWLLARRLAAGLRD